MQAWINQTLESPTFSFTVLLASFLLGLVSAVATAGCVLPVFGAVVGYSSAQKQRDRRASISGAIFFMLGTTIAVIILGSVAGFIGQVAQASLGKYWKIFAGLVAISFGLATLGLLPVKLGKLKTSGQHLQSKGFFTAAAFGLIIGGAVVVCSLCCNPPLFIVLGVVVLQGYTFLTMAILTCYAIGFSLPLTAIVLGISFGKMAVKAKKTETVIRIIAGVLLIIAGFYFLATL